jgi:hypothetical protein
MDQFSSARLSESATPLPPSERTGSGTSGTRRIVAAAPGRRSEPQASSGVAPRWSLAEPLRTRGIVLSLALATLAGGAGPLLVSISSGETNTVDLASVSSLFFLSLAVFAWTSPYWHTGVKLDVLRSWLRSWLELKGKLLALDLRALPRAPKNLAIYLASHWLRGVGVAGLLVSGALSFGQQLVGSPVASPLLGLSLTSAALVTASALLGWALRLQPRCSDASPDSLALAVREFPAIVDASQRLELDTVFMQPTLIHQVLELLPSWRDVVRGAGANGYAAALQRHLWRGIPRARIERQRTTAQPDDIAELVIDDAVLIAVQVGIDRTRAHALVERLRSQARRRGAHASVVVVVEAQAEALLHADVAEPLRSVHEALPVVIAALS